MKIGKGRVILDGLDILYYVDYCGFRPVPENSVDCIRIGDKSYTRESFTAYVQSIAECGCCGCIGVLIDRLVKCTHSNRDKENKLGVRVMTEYYSAEIDTWIESAEELRKECSAPCIRKH